MSYAEGTTVPVAKSQAEVKALLSKHGATHYAFGESPEVEVVQFRLGVMYRFDVQRPVAADMRAAFIEAQNGTWNATRRADAIDWNGRAAKEHMRRWRARLLWLKAMLEFTDVVPLSESLMANLVLPDGQTFGHWAGPQVEAMYELGQMPAMLGDGR